MFSKPYLFIVSSIFYAVETVDAQEKFCEFHLNI